MSPTTTTTAYVVTFERIGRSHDIAPLELTLPEDETVGHAISEAVYEYARPYLRSQDLDVVTNLGETPGTGGTGTIFAGFQVGGRFTVTPAPKEA